MADTIVKSFVIDTSKAEQNLRSLDAATIVTKNSLDALYNQLVQLDAQLNGLDPSSEAFANVNTQIQALEATISNIETGGIQNIGTALDDIDTAKVKEVGDAIQSIDTGDAARNIENVADAVEQVVAPVNQLSSATGELNDELKDTKVDTSNLDTAASEYKDLAVTQEEVVTSSKSLKAQLRELQAQLAATDPDSAKYRELSQAAGELKDRIQDAAQAVGTQAGGAFERVGGSLGLVTSRIANLDFQGAAEGAKQLAANIGQVKPGDIAKGISSIGSAFASVGKALLTNPIFLIGAAIAAAIVYADELLSLIDGVTDAEQEALNVQKERAAQSKQQLDAIGEQENILKLQGRTEREILDLKIAQANQAILDQKAVILTTEIQRQAQIDAAERNRKIVSGILQFLTAPLQLILAQLDLVTKTAKDLGVISEETFNKVGNLRDKFNTSISTLAFDPAEVAEKGNATVEEQKKILKQLENTQAGFQLSIKSIDDKAASDRKTAAEKRAADAKSAADKASADKIKAEQEVSDLLEQLYQENLKEFEDAEKAKTEAALKEKQKQLDAATTYYNKLAALQDAEFESTLTASEKEELAVTQKYEDLFAAADAYNATLKTGEEANAIDIVALQKQLASELLAIQQKSAKDEGDVQDQSSQQSAERAQQVYQAKLQFISDGFATIANLADAFGKGDEARAKKAFKIQKAASVAQATVDTYKAAQGIFANAALNPKTILFPAQPYIEAALAVAAGLVNVKKISSQQFQSSGTPPSSPPPSGGGGGGGGESQPAQFNPLASQFIQDRPEQVTPRAFVLAGDVASQQEVREKVQDLARLG